LKLQWLIVILEIVFLLALVGIVSSYYVVFKKIKTTKKYQDKNYFIALIIGFAISFLTVFANLGLNIYVYDKQGGLFSNVPVIKVIWIILICISYIVLIAITACLYFRLNRIVIALDERNINFLGEKVLYRQIVNLKTDSNKSRFIIFYKEGKVFANKKYTFALDSKAYFFLKNHIEFINERIKIEKEKFEAIRKQQIKKEEQLKNAYLEQKNKTQAIQNKKEAQFNLEQEKKDSKINQKSNESK